MGVPGWNRVDREPGTKKSASLADFFDTMGGTRTVQWARCVELRVAFAKGGKLTFVAPHATDIKAHKAEISVPIRRRLHRIELCSALVRLSEQPVASLRKQIGCHNVKFQTLAVRDAIRDSSTGTMVLF